MRALGPCVAADGIPSQHNEIPAAPLVDLVEAYGAGPEGRILLFARIALAIRADKVNN
jgi:hypothetical protein